MEALTSSMEIYKVEQSRIAEVDFNNIPFGREFSDHMLVCDCIGWKWQQPRIIPYQRVEVYPSVSALHYGQSVFEGMKAFKNQSGDGVLFRPEDNFNRINVSAERLCMPAIPREIFMGGLKELLRLDHNWIPTQDGSSLYIRPFMFATDEYVGIKPSDNYKFVIFSCPVGAYYPKPVKLLVTTDYVRAFEGGTGEAKAAGNYAGSLIGQKMAKEQGYDNILWLDGKEHSYIEECGTMNIFFVIDGVAVTPSLTGTILDGITRDSTITLLKERGVKVEERQVSINEVATAYNTGSLTEVFGTGTAATIAMVDRIGFNGRDMDFNPADFTIANSIKEQLTNIRIGKAPDTYHWIEPIN